MSSDASSLLSEDDLSSTQCPSPILGDSAARGRSDDEDDAAAAAAQLSQEEALRQAASLSALFAEDDDQDEPTGVAMGAEGRAMGGSAALTAAVVGSDSEAETRAYRQRFSKKVCLCGRKSCSLHAIYSYIDRLLS